MSGYVVLARKWRSAQFKDIVGQGPVVRTLMNAIQANRIHQAYLFTGSRGIGKTSIARIFAKAVRCPNPRVENGWLFSCDECPSCKEIAAGNSVDVIEIDGASNNGVDAIRDIRENAKYLPSSGSKKIYIIDEVHMLTTAAFNALLKTLEEPPAHVIFIFATTEPHKIPATILSRCQRFDFKKVTVTQAQGHITKIAQAEDIQIDPAATTLIAKAAEGSMRDALSILDQVIAYSGRVITLESARDSIGVIENQAVLAVLQGVLSRNPLAALEQVNTTYDQGHDLKVLLRSLIEFLYGVILAKIEAPAPAILEASPEEWKELQGLSSLRSLEEMELIFQVLHHGMETVSRSPQPKIALDLLLIKCATAEVLVSAHNSALSAAPVPAESSIKKQEPIAKPDSSLQAAPAPVASAVSTSVSWPGFVDHVRKARPLLAAILEYASHAELPHLSDSSVSNLTLTFKPEETYRREQLQSRAYADELGNLAQGYFGKPVIVKTLTQDSTGESLASRRERERKEKEQSAREAVQNNPIIREARALFGGDLGPIEFPDHESSQGEARP